MVEPDRYTKIKDRSKDIIISGGENISSIEVEDALGVDGRSGGGMVRGWGGEELIAHCGGLLAGYKVPNEVRSEAIPKTSTGKIEKF